MRKTSLIVALILALSITAVGYAQLSSTLSVNSGVEFASPPYDVYISSIDPKNDAGVTVLNAAGTLLSATVTGSGTATFSITIRNKSDKTYVFERMLDGVEANIEGVYNGSDITYTVDGLVPLQEIAPNGGTVSLHLQITVPTGVTADLYALKFLFVEKQGIEILPDDPDPTPNPGDLLHGDFLGLVEALLSTESNCLNDSDMIYDAVMEALTSDKRPEEDAPILHCSVNSVSGGTMTDVANSANSKLTENLHFIFEADATNENRLFLYMYYEEDCTEDRIGSEILVYRQIVSRGEDGVWHEDGTYIGRATVGYYYGGGKNGKDVLTVDAYSWKSGRPAT